MKVRGQLVATGVSLFLFIALLIQADSPAQKDFASKLAEAVLERTHHIVVYDGSYRKIGYPNGDVPPNIGVCTDLVIRAYRAVGIDLQKLVHEDMKTHFDAYPDNWELKRPDSNIDHRRVPNLARFFVRHGDVLPVTHDGKDYGTGEVVTWMLPGNLPHIGIVADKRTADGKRPLVIHNIGAGPAWRTSFSPIASPATSNIRP